MNFSRVKLLFLSIFLALNAFLIAQWLDLQSSVSVYAQPVSDQLAHAQSVLAMYHVRLDAGIPASPTQMGLLRVARDGTGLVGIAATMFGVKPAQAQKWRRGPTHLDAPGAQYAELAPGSFVVRFRPPVVLQRAPFSRQHVNTEDWHTWLQKHGYNADNYEELNSSGGDKRESVTYDQTLAGYPVFTARLVLQIEAGKLTALTQQSLVLTNAYAPRPIINAVSALLSLADFLDKTDMSADNTIQNIRIGYAALLTTPTQWVLAPVWRMQTTRGVFFVNALSGEVGVGLQ